MQEKPIPTAAAVTRNEAEVKIDSAVNRKKKQAVKVTQNDASLRKTETTNEEDEIMNSGEDDTTDDDDGEEEFMTDDGNEMNDDEDEHLSQTSE